MYTLKEIIVIKLETLRGCKLQLLMNYYVPCMNRVRGHISTTYTIHTTRTTPNDPWVLYNGIIASQK